MPRQRYLPDVDRDTLLAARRARMGGFQESQTNYLKARGQTIQEEIAHERFDIQRQNLELARTKQLTEFLKQRAAMELQQQQQMHTVKALETLGTLDPSSKDYHLHLAEVFKDNPLASRDKLVQDIVRSQIQTRHVMDVADSEIKQHEEAQASEFSRIHGIDVVRNPHTGRVDWTASGKAAQTAEDTRQKQLLERVDPSLKPSGATVTAKGLTQQFKAEAPDIISTKTSPPTEVGGTPKTTVTVTKKVAPGSGPAPTGPVSVGGITIGGGTDSRPPLTYILP